MYKLEKAKQKENDDNFYYIVCINDIPDFPTSRWLKLRSSSSLPTAYKYGNVLVRFFNYLSDRKVAYYNASKSDLRNFFIDLIDFDKNGNYSVKPVVQYRTIISYKAVLISFYKYLTNFYDNNIVTTVEVSKDSAPLSVNHVVRIRWNDINIIVNDVIDLHMTKFKTADKEYIKMYSIEEIVAISDNFNTIRNRAIFHLTLYGLRIDEVLSIKLKDYNNKEGIVKPSRSKGRKRDQIREVVIGMDAINPIEAYLFHERRVAEQLAAMQKQSCEYLFVTTRVVYNELDFKQYTSASYRSAFYTAAKRAGIIKDVRTHSGRSHRAIELLRMANEGKVKLSDEQIRLIMGWKSMKSAEPYIEVENKRMADEIVKEVTKQRIKKIDEFRKKMQDKVKEEK